MRPSFALAFLFLLIAFPAHGRELPRVGALGPELAGPAVRDDALLLRLNSGAARRASALSTGRAPGASRAAIGLASLDAAAARLGGARFEPLFERGAALALVSAPAGLEGYFRVTLPPGVDLDRAIADFAALPEVVSAEPIGVVPMSVAPNDSLYPVSTWFYQPSRRDVHVEEAWAMWPGDTTMVIGIMDTGVLLDHPDLAGSVLGEYGNLWSNWAERSGVPGVDDDGNGKVDDFLGWDFVESAVGGPYPQGEDVDTADNDPSDYAGHGTLVAGIAGAITDNTIGVAGTARTVRLMPLRIGWSTNARPLGVVDMSYVAEAIVYATQNGASVLNGSFETVANTALSNAIAWAAGQGVFIVFAAGNGGGPNVMQQRNDVISVASVGPTDLVSGFSNLGPFIDVSAPGENIRSTAVAKNFVVDHYEIDPTYSSLSGTSFSTPIVTGGVALWEGRRRALGDPRLDPTNLALRLWDTADDIRALNPLLTGYGGGRLNLERLFLDPPVSRAFRAGARTTGPSVVIHERTRTLIAWVAGNRALVIQDAVNGDTLATATLPAALARQIAAADLGGGHGLGIFGGTNSGRMCGYDVHGVVLPGWPFFAGSGFVQYVAGPAIGDLDGDGVMEIACGASDGSVWAWDVGGNVLPGFPVATAASGIAGAIAIAHVLDAPGEQIVVASKDGQLHVIASDGSEAPGFPVAIPGPVPTMSPVVASFAGGPAILVAGGTQLRAFDFAGGVLWNSAIGGTAAFDPALVDFDGDGFDEVVIPTSSPNSVTALSGAGSVLAGRGWPASLSTAAAGAPVAGPVAAGVPRGVALFAGSNLVALSDSARVLGSLLKQGGAGSAPSLDDTDGDGRTEVAAGTGPDSLYYVYDAGAGSWATATPGWPTLRGDYARRGNRISPLAIPVLDLTPPATIADLGADSLTLASVTLQWTAPGGDGSVGQAARYDLSVSTFAGDAAQFKPGALRGDAPVPGPAGTAEHYRIAGIAPGTSLFAAVRAVDSTGNVGTASSVIHVMTPLGPLRPSRPIALAPAQQPSVRQVRWVWRLADVAEGPSREIQVFDVVGRKVRTLPVGPGESGVVEWNGRDDENRVVPAGIFFARLVSGSVHAQSRVVLLP